MNSKSKNQLDSLIKDFSQTEAQLVALVTKILATGNLAGLRARRRASRESTQILDHLRSLSIPRTAALVKSSYLAGREASNATNKSLSDTDRIALQLLTDNLNGTLEDSIVTVKRRINDVLRREGLRANAMTLSKAVADEDAIKKFHKQLVNQGVTSFTDSRGGRWGLETYARMALKTSMMEAVNTGAENLIRERGYDIIAIGHQGHFEPDALCSPHHNKKYSLLGRAAGLPVFTPMDKPPYHPNCEHFIKLGPGSVAERRSALRAA